MKIKILADFQIYISVRLSFFFYIYQKKSFVKLYSSTAPCKFWSLFLNSRVFGVQKFFDEVSYLLVPDSRLLKG